MSVSRRIVPSLGLAVASLVLAACGAAKPAVTTGSSVSYTPPASGCGSYKAAAPSDPDGVLASLPQAARVNFAGEPQIRKSAWAAFKPRHAPPYDVTVIMSGATNSLQVQLIDGFKKQLAAAPEVGATHFLLTDGIDIPTQLQQMNSAIQKGTDLFILEPLQAEAFVGPVAKAGKAGIPTVSFLSAVDSPYALNITKNAYRQGAVQASFIARQAHGKGSVLVVAGFPTTQSDILTLKATKDIIRSCPGMKLGGQVIGAYNNGAAKSEVFKFLATHPTPLSGVMQGGTMSQGILSAFVSTGKTPPTVADQDAVQGSLAYWRDHRSTYHGVGVGPGPSALVTSVVSVARRTLAGQGPLVNKFLGELPVVTEKNLDQWVPAKAPFTDLSPANGPAGTFLPDSYLDKLFARGSAVK